MKNIFFLLISVYIVACSASKEEAKIIYNDCSVNIIEGNWYSLDIGGNDSYNNPFETSGPYSVIKVLKIDKEKRFKTVITAVYYEQQFKERPKKIIAADTANYIPKDTAKYLITSGFYIAPIYFSE